MRNITIDLLTYPGSLCLQPGNVGTDGAIVLAPGMAYYTVSPDPNESTTGSINFYWASTNKPIFNDGPYTLTQIYTPTTAEPFDNWESLQSYLSTAMSPYPAQYAFARSSDLKGGLVKINSDGVTISATLVAEAYNYPPVLNGLVAANSMADVAFVKLYDLAAPPDPALDIPTMVLVIPPMNTLVFNPQLPLQFSAGLAMTIVGYAADTDDTPVQADGLIVTLGIKY